MSQILNPNGGGGGGSGITTINGDTGSITGSTVTIYAHNSTNNSGQTVLFVNSGTVSTLNVTDSAGNTTIGKLAGSSALVADGGENNTALGQSALATLTDGGSNVGIGYEAGTLMTGDSGNTAIGASSMAFSSNSSSNTAIGYGTLSITTGSNNTALGDLAGSNYVSTESSNIVIGNLGIVGDSNVMRLGTTGGSAGQVNKAFIAAVTGVTVTASAPVAVDTNGQLSSLGFGTATQVLTSNGAGNSPTWKAGGGGATPNSFLAILSASPSDVTGDGSTYQIPYDTVIYDTATAFTTGVYAHYTFPTTGKWHISIGVCYNPTTGSGSLFATDAVMTSTTFRSLQTQTIVATDYVTIVNTFDINVSSTDTLLVNAINSGGSKNTSILGSGGGFYLFNFYFWIFRFNLILE